MIGRTSVSGEESRLQSLEKERGLKKTFSGSSWDDPKIRSELVVPSTMSASDSDEDFELNEPQNYNLINNTLSKMYKANSSDVGPIESHQWTVMSSPGHVDHVQNLETIASAPCDVSFAVPMETSGSVAATFESVVQPDCNDAADAKPAAAAVAAETTSQAGQQQGDRQLALPIHEAGPPTTVQLSTGGDANLSLLPPPSQPLPPPPPPVLQQQQQPPPVLPLQPTLPQRDGNKVSSPLKRGHNNTEDHQSQKKREKVKRRRTDKAVGESVTGKDAPLAQQDEERSGRKQSKVFAIETPSLRLSDMGGIDECFKDISKFLVHLKHPEVFKRLGTRPPQGFLLHGPPGSGKTMMAHAIAGELGLPFIKLAATEVVSGVSGESEEILRDLFQQAKESAPCVLFIDEIDAISPKRETAHREMERRIVTQLLTCLDELGGGDGDAHVLVIGATNRPDSLDPALRRAGRFDREIFLGIPSEQSREHILRVLCRGLKIENDFNFSLLAHQTPGFVGADLAALAQEASLCAVNRVLVGIHGLPPTPLPAPVGSLANQLQSSRVEATMQWLKQQPPLTPDQLQSVFVSMDDFKEALHVVQPSAKREGFVTVPDVTWADVGALVNIREELSMAILAPVRYPKQFASLGLTNTQGILLAGPPGCGKTLLAKAIANESGINFISVKGPELLNMYVGESEKAVRQVFLRARNSAPCVIFFDELDALCPKRSDMAESSASARVVNQMLTEMDGLEARKQVFIMAATNRPDIIDPAVLRPGRLDKILYVPLPSAKDREDILNTLTKERTRPKLAADVDLAELASDKFCAGFSGADLSALVREAATLALREHMEIASLTASKCALSPQPFDTCVVSQKHFVLATEKVMPSVSASERRFYEDMACRQKL